MTKLASLGTAILTGRIEKQPELLPVKEFARQISVSVWSARKWAYVGKIASVKLGSKLLIPASEITRLVGANFRPYKDTD